MRVLRRRDGGLGDLLDLGGVRVRREERLVRRRLGGKLGRRGGGRRRRRFLGGRGGGGIEFVDWELGRRVMCIWNFWNFWLCLLSEMNACFYDLRNICFEVGCDDSAKCMKS